MSMKPKRHLKLQTHYFIMTLPGLLWLFFFSIVPLRGIVMAFENYNPGMGLWKSPFVGLENFKYLFSLGDAKRVIINTIIIAGSKIILNILVPLTFALLLNEVKHLRYKKIVQTAVYLPHFLSWVILASVLLNVFSLDGIVNQIMQLMGKDSVIWFSESKYFRQLVIGTDVWKEFGFNAVIYLAALTGIDPTLYEAAAIDGCSRWKQILNITLPGIAGTIILMAVLGLAIRELISSLSESAEDAAGKQKFLLVCLQYDSIYWNLPDPVWWISGNPAAAELFAEGFVSHLKQLDQSK